MLKRLLLILSLLSSLLLIVSPSAAQDNPSRDVVHAGILGLLVDMPLFVAQEMGYFDRFNLQLDTTTFKSGADAVPALATGQIDFTLTSYTAGIFNALGRGVDVKFIAAASTADDLGNSGLFVSTALYSEMKANPDAGFSVLKGKTIATNGLGNSAHLFYDWLLQDAGLTLNDVNLEVLSLPDQLAGLQSGAIAAGILADPVATAAELSGIGIRVKSIPELFGGPHDTALMVASSAFVNERRDVAVRMLAAFLLGSRDVRQAFVLKEQPIRDQVLDILQKALPSIQDPEVLARVYTPGGAPNGEINVDAAHRFLDGLQSLNMIEVDTINLDSAIDTTIAQDAVTLIGRWDETQEQSAATPQAAA